MKKHFFLISNVLTGWAATCLVFLSAKTNGAAIFPDSVNYLHAARSLLESGDWIQFTGDAFVAWPPLFSLLIAFVYTISPFSIPQSAFLINVIAAGVSASLLHRILNFEKQESLLMTGVTALLSLFSWPMITPAFDLISEPVFILFALLSFYTFVLKEKTYSGLIFSIFGILQRYIGAVFFAYFFILGWFRTQNKRKWLAISFTSLILVFVWLARNYIQTQTLTGVRSSSEITLFSNFILGFEVISHWFIPHFIPLSVNALVILLLIFFFMKNRHIVAKNRVVYHSFAIALTYILSIWLISTSGASEFLSYRMLAPAYPFLLIGSWHFFNDLISEKEIKVRSLILVLFTCLTLYQSVFMSRIILDRIKNGSGGFSRNEWIHSSTMEWFRQHPELQNRVVSNAADAIYAATEIRVPLSPFLTKGADADSILRSDHYLVWFHNMNRKTMISLDSLKTRYSLTPIIFLDDGSVWLRE